MRKIRMSGIFKQAITGFALTVVCLGAQAVTKLEIDSYNSIGSEPYATGVPWEYKGTTTFGTNDGTFALSYPYSGNSDYANSVSIGFDSFKPYSEGGRWIDVDFSTDKLNVPLAVGVYEGAQRFPFNAPGHPGLDLTDTGGGFNTLDGRFQIYDLVRNAQGNITSFAASFEIYNYPAPSNSPLVGGRVWYNSDVAIPAVPEPETWVMVVLGLAGLGTAARRHRVAV